MGLSKTVTPSFVSTALIVLAFLAGQLILPEIVEPTPKIVPKKVVAAVTPDIPNALMGRQLERLDPQQNGNVIGTHKDDSTRVPPPPPPPNLDTRMNVSTAWKFDIPDAPLAVSIVIIGLIGMATACSDMSDMSEESGMVESKESAARGKTGKVRTTSGKILPQPVQPLLMVSLLVGVLAIVTPYGVFDVGGRGGPAWLSFAPIAAGSADQVSDELLTAIVSFAILFGFVCARADIAEMMEDRGKEDIAAFDPFPYKLFSLRSPPFFILSSLVAGVSVMVSADVMGWIVGAMPFLLCVWSNGLKLAWRFSNEAVWEMSDHFLCGITLVVVLLGLIVSRTDIKEMIEDESDDSVTDSHSLQVVPLAVASALALTVALAVSFDIGGWIMCLWGSLASWDAKRSENLIVPKVAHYLLSWDCEMSDTMLWIVLAIFALIGFMVASIDIHEMSEEDGEEGGDSREDKSETFPLPCGSPDARILTHLTIFICFGMVPMWSDYCHMRDENEANERNASIHNSSQKS